MPTQPQSQQPVQQQKLHPVFERFIKNAPKDWSYDEENQRVIMQPGQQGGQPYYFKPTGEFIAPDNMDVTLAASIADRYKKFLDFDTIPNEQKSGNYFIQQGTQKPLYSKPATDIDWEAYGLQAGGQYQDLDAEELTREGAVASGQTALGRQTEDGKTYISRGEGLALVGGVVGGGLLGGYGLYKSGMVPYSLYNAETALTHMSPRKWIQWNRTPDASAKGMFAPREYNLALDPSKDYSKKWFEPKGLESRRGTNLQNYMRQRFPGVDVSKVGTAPITDKSGFLPLHLKKDNIPGAERFRAQQPPPKTPTPAPTPAAPPPSTPAASPAATASGASAAARTAAATPPVRPSNSSLLSGNRFTPSSAYGTQQGPLVAPVNQAQAAAQTSQTVQRSGMSPNKVNRLLKVRGKNMGNIPKVLGPVVLGGSLLTGIATDVVQHNKIRNVDEGELMRNWNVVLDHLQMNPQDMQYQTYKSTIQREMERRGLKNKGDVGPSI